MDFPEIAHFDGGSSDLHRRDDITYPSGDGEPMAETQTHGDALLLIFFQLQTLRELRGRLEDWFFIRDNFWYFERGDPKRVCAPDIAVIPGATDPLRKRDSWLEWNEGGKRPTVIFEMASRGTVRDNLTDKKDMYESLGVAEYYLFDPTGQFLDPVLRGFRLTRGRYRELAPDARSQLESRELGVFLRVEGEDCRMYDRATGDRILTPQERQVVQTRQQSARADQQAAKAEAEAARANEVVAQNERLRQALRDAGIDPDSFSGPANR